jgi:hypothetical protein
VAHNTEEPPVGEGDEAAEPSPEEPVEPLGEGRDNRDIQIAWTPDELAHRAFQAALFGWVGCPGVLQLYSLWLLFRLTFLPGELSTAAARKAYVALLIDLPVLIGVMLLLGFGFRLLFAG